jgi:hypothetical protein
VRSGMLPSTMRARKGISTEEAARRPSRSLIGRATQGVLDALRMPPRDMYDRMKDKKPFALGKSENDDGRLEHLQLLALKPDVLWQAMQSYSEIRIVVASLLMGVGLTLLQLPRAAECGPWAPDTCYWLGSVADWLSLLCILLMFMQLICSLFSMRICATVPPHRMHEFIAECTGLVPRPMLNREDMLNGGMFIMFFALGINMVLRHPGIQGLVEGVAISVVPFGVVYKMALSMSFQTRILWSVAWGHHPHKFKQEATLLRIGQHAGELASDIEAALVRDDY